MAEIYILIMVAVIPFISWQQREEGRNLIAMLVTGTLLIAYLITSFFPVAFGEVVMMPIVWDTTTILVFCFGLWMIASLSWSNSRQSSQDLYTMLCGLVVFLIARRISLELLLVMLFVPGVIFAAISVIYCKSEDIKLKYFCYGNRNHTAAFMLIPFFVGIWLMVTFSWLLAPVVLIIGVALAISQCRGAQVGLICGLMYLFASVTLWTLILIPFALVGAWLIIRSRGNNFYNSTSGRINLYVAAMMLIKKAPFTGHGLRTFRREYPGIVPELLEKTELFVKEGTVEGANSHRIHNDHLELIVELGIIGYVLFLAIFTTLSWNNPILTGAIIAFGIHALFFFPLREAHTAFPFWALAGGLAATSAPLMSINPIIGFVLMLIVGRVMWSVGVKLLGLTYYDCAVKIPIAPNITELDGKHSEGARKLALKQDFLNSAIQCDPYNNIYLTEGYYYNVFTNPEVAFQYASRCMENYDGGKVKWGVADQYARALLRLGGFKVAKLAVSYALRICPGFKQSTDLMAQIEQLEAGGVKA